MRSIDQGGIRHGGKVEDRSVRTKVSHRAVGCGNVMMGMMDIFMCSHRYPRSVGVYKINCMGENVLEWQKSG